MTFSEENRVTSGTTTIVPVILAGGGGTRLWPLSRALYPKQFLSLHGEGSMLQQTLVRLSGFVAEDFSVEPPIVVCNEAHRFLVAEHARQANIPLGGIVLEPEGRNTAPALALAAERLAGRGASDAIMVMMPADHLIPDRVAFHSALRTAARAAAEGHLVTFGVVPTHAETGYGYIEFGSAVPGYGDDADPAAHELVKFVEKPDADTAARYMDAGNFLWNSGLFVMRVGVWQDALQTFQPVMARAVAEACVGAQEDGDFIRPDHYAFIKSPADSIDYAVMEHIHANSEAANGGADGEAAFSACVVPLDAGWSDIGAWSSVWDVMPRDQADNALVGDAHVEGGRGNVVYADSRLVTAVGVDDMVIVETADAVMVAPRQSAQDVKHLVAWLKANGRDEENLHRKVYRPWGSYEGVDAGARFQVKRIVVNPGEKLSLQMHHHRAEHWIVVHGTARVTKGDETFMLAENESTYIPLGVTHRLENPGVIPLELIEVQSGAYLGEDDIVRFEDVYNRG